jgi:hypothetical protein
MGKYKRGFVREDGLVFARMQDGKEVWVTADSYARRENTRRAYVKKAYDAYKRRQLAKPIEDRNYLGRYDPYRDKYFLGLSSSGKEIWGSKDMLIRKRKMADKRRREFRERCDALEHQDKGFGQPHPTKPGLFVILRIGNKLYYGNQDRLNQISAGRQRSYKKRNIKYRRRRDDILRSLTVRHKRGDIGTDGLIFWEYTLTAKEIWLAPEDYAIKHKASCDRRKKYHERKKVRE